MKNLVFFFAFFISAPLVFAQNIERKNSVIVETNIIATLSFSYDRIIPCGEKSSIMLGADYIMGVGFGHGSHWVSPEINLLSFGPKHFLETGVCCVYDLQPDEEVNYSHSPGLRIAYRFQNLKGLTFRISTSAFFNIDPPVVPAVGIGYTF